MSLAFMTALPKSLCFGEVYRPRAWSDSGSGACVSALGRHGSRRRCAAELIADAAIEAPALGVLALAVIEPRIAEPAGVAHLRRNTHAVLAVGADAACGQLEDRHRRCSVEAKLRVLGELMPDARRHERLPHDGLGDIREPDPHAGAAHQ